MAGSFRDLEAWKMAFSLAESVYVVTRKLPDEEKFGVVSQLRRSVVSVASNIAEGAGRNSKKEFVQFLGIAYGSCCEVETQLLLTKALYKFLSEDIDKTLLQLASVGRLIKGLQKSLTQQLSNPATQQPRNLEA